MKIVVYTAIFGGIDKLWPPYPPAMDGAEFVCLSDQTLPSWGNWDGDKLVTRDRRTAGGYLWDQRLIRPGRDNRRNARYCKALPHKMFPDADVSIWVDGNLRLLIPPAQAVEQWIRGGSELAIFSHPDRRCLYAEAQFCQEKGKDIGAVLRAQVSRYRRDGMPINWGLPETRCMVRKHTDKINELGEVWWDEMKEYSARDQVSLPYLCWKAGMMWDVIPGRAWVSGDRVNKDFWFTRHGKKGDL